MPGHCGKIVKFITVGAIKDTIIYKINLAMGFEAHSADSEMLCYLK